MSLFRFPLVSLAALIAAGPALADCGITAGSVRILSNDFEALRVLNDLATTCATDAVTVTANATTEHKNIQVPALSVNPAEYTVAMVANNSIVPLMNDGLIRPLDDLVATYGQQLLPGQLITIDGQVMAVAFMANSQHLFLRQDLLDAAGIAAPTSYEEMIAAAEVLKAAGFATPLAASDAAGWELAAEFVNSYLGTGGEFFVPGSAELAIDNEQARTVLATMAAMTPYMGSDWQTYNSDTMAQMWRSGTIAMMVNWGSLAGSVIDPAEADPVVLAGTVIAAAPTIGGGTIPAAALWWDGFTIASNISDEDAAASFQAMMHAMAPSTAVDHASAATWLIDGFQPGPAAAGVIGTAQAGARPYPMVPYMGLLHEVLGVELADFLAGTEDADTAIADITAAYTAAATSAGFLQ
jgi:multiple sugar transport system substrate-binding protein